MATDRLTGRGQIILCPRGFVIPEAIFADMLSARGTDPQLITLWIANPQGQVKPPTIHPAEENDPMKGNKIMSIFSRNLERNHIFAFTLTNHDGNQMDETFWNAHWYLLDANVFSFCRSSRQSELDKVLLVRGATRIRLQVQ
ncbi:MAG: hypothetical protein IJ734_06535 [Fibrobacter sp.]|nr:hypothetical protein [Fibrobacter sp.]